MEERWWEFILNANPEDLFCTHPDEPNKRFSLDKVRNRCLKGPCPFLNNWKVVEGREGPSERMVFWDTRPSRRFYPGE